MYKRRKYCDSQLHKVSFPTSGSVYCWQEINDLTKYFCVNDFSYIAGGYTDLNSSIFANIDVKLINIFLVYLFWDYFEEKVISCVMF